MHARREHADQRSITDAAGILQAGGLVAFPTETVYGLGGDATNGRAVAAIFEAKGRPRFNPLICHVADMAGAEQLGEFNDTARQLAVAFWPGPLTLIVPKRSGCRVSELATAGLETIAIRIPNHPTALSLLASAGLPIAAPSANRSGGVSPTTAAHVAADLGERIAMILDGGPASIGVESTVIDATSDHCLLLRPGAVTGGDVARVTGCAPVIGKTRIGMRETSAGLSADGAPTAPGQLRSHYAPRAVLRLNAAYPVAGEAFIAFGSPPPGFDAELADVPTINLSPDGDLVEAAAALFATLRSLDDRGVARIAVMPIPRGGLGDAINDRLSRAAAPRP